MPRVSALSFTGPGTTSVSTSSVHSCCASHACWRAWRHSRLVSSSGRLTARSAASWGSTAAIGYSAT
ncbi:hypothetical protein ACVW1J_003784 [Serratia marcescens]